MTVTGPSNNLATQIRGLFKDVKVNDKRALKGNLSGEVFIKLPLGGGSVSRRLQGNGALVARDGELTNVDLIKKLQRVTGMMGLSKEQGRDASSFMTLETEFTLAGGFDAFRCIHLSIHQLDA